MASAAAAASPEAAEAENANPFHVFDSWDIDVHFPFKPYKTQVRNHISIGHSLNHSIDPL